MLAKMPYNHASALGAATFVWCATSSLLDGKGGVYIMNVDISEVIPEFSLEGTTQIVAGVLPWAIDLGLADRLWWLSEQLTDCSLPD